MTLSYSVLLITSVFVTLLCSGSHAKIRACDEGWKPIPKKCLKIIEEPLPWIDAWLKCKQYGGNASLIEIYSETANIQLLNALSGTKLDYWLSIRSVVYRNYRRGYYHGARSKLVWNNTRRDLANGYSNFQQSSYDYEGESEKCGFFGAQGQWYTAACKEKLRSLCTTANSCEVGYYGDDCTRQCHCFDSGCDRTTGKCQYGCEAGWTGEKCDSKQMAASASIYCFDSPIEGKYASILVNPMNVHYQTLSLVSDTDKSRCPKTMFKREINGIFSIRINMTSSALITNPSCPVHSSGKNVYTWTLKTEEIAGFYGYYDRLFKLRCDFNTAETLERAVNKTFSGKMTTNQIIVNQTREDVGLFIRNPVTSEKISEVKLGSPIFLSMVLNKTDGKLSANGISPHSCKISSVDGTVQRRLIAETGCPEPNGSVPSFKGTNMTYLVTNSFKTFTLFNQSVVVLSCHFQFCFNENAPLCKDRCHFFKSRRLKRSADSKITSQELSVAYHGSSVAYLRLIDNDASET